MTDQAVISPAALQEAISELNHQGAEILLGGIQQAEPVLGPFIHHMAIQVAGKLALAGAPTEYSPGRAYRPAGSLRLDLFGVPQRQLPDLARHDHGPAAQGPGSSAYRGCNRQ